MDERPPDIVSMEELMTRKEFADLYRVSEVTVDQWRYGRGGAFVPLPYFRFAGTVYLWRGAIIWWFNQQRKRPDAYAIDRKRRLEQGEKVGRKKKY